jgi:hypothetical protein
MDEKNPLWHAVATYAETFAYQFVQQIDKDEDASEVLEEGLVIGGHQKTPTASVLHNIEGVCGVSDRSASRRTRFRERLTSRGLVGQNTGIHRSPL